MEARLTAESFSKLLLRLDEDPEHAGQKYEELRRKLIRFFEWRGAPFPEEQTDETLNRLTKRIDEGVAVRNLDSYTLEIARLVFLEALKGNDFKKESLDEINVAASPGDETREKEVRLTCLDECLNGLPQNNRELIIEYYRDTKRERIDRRRALAERLSLNREALANRAQRLRDKLEQCVNRCLSRKLSI